jgi:hypothetical protein
MTLKTQFFTRFVLKAIVSLTLLGTTPQYLAAQNACVSIISLVGINSINIKSLRKVATKDTNFFIVPSTQNGDQINKHMVAVPFFKKKGTYSSLNTNIFQALMPNPIISGKALVCPNEEVTYSTPLVGNGTTWQWAIQSGGVITQTNNNTVRIRWNNLQGTTGHKITVIEKDNLGNTTTAELLVSIRTTTLRCAGSFTTSLDNTCKTNLTTDMVLIGAHVGASEMRMQLLSGTTVLEEGIGSIDIDGISKNGTPYELISKTYAYKIIEPCTNNSCGANITFEDGVPPMVQCPKDTTFGCAQVGQASSPLPQSAGEPLVTDCSTTSYTYTDQSFTTPCTQPFTALPAGVPAGYTLPTTGDIVRVIVRYFTIKDKWNNTTTCEQVIFIRKGNVAQVICPQDIEFTCQEGRTTLTLAQTGSPVIDSDGDFLTTNDRYPLENFTCQMSYKFVDDTFRLCAGSFKIVRYWTIFDFCAVDNPATSQDERRKECSQIINVLDKTTPSVSAYYTQHYSNGSALILNDTSVFFDGYSIVGGANYEPFAADIYPLSNLTCGANVRLTLKATDISCTNKQVNFICSDSRIKLIGVPSFDTQNLTTTAIFEGSFAAIGDYIFFIEVKDECGLALSKKRFRLRVQDNANPQATCKTNMQASITTGGVARLNAVDMSDFSRDNCGIDRYEIRRISNCQNAADTIFRPFVDFNCCDAGKSHMVVLRVWDMAGNYNECMSSVFVNDKTNPSCVAPAPKTLICKDLDVNNLNIYGTPVFSDNCSIRDTVYSVIKNLNSCGIGTITRKWVVRDNSNLSSECTQVITVTSKSDFIVDFPDDIVANCFAAIPTHAQLRDKLLKNAPTEDGHIINNGCGIMAINIKDDTLTSGTGACYVIYRKISVIDMCKNINPNTANEAYGMPICGDIHANTAWQTQNAAWWETLSRPACTNSRERRFRDADGLVSGLSDPNAFSDGIISFTQIIKVIDNTPPQFIAVPKDTVIADVSNVCEGLVKLTATAQDQCNSARVGDENLQYSWRVVDKNQPATILQQGMGNQLSVVLPYGKEAIVYWTAIDRCGNVANAQHLLKVIDGKSPSLNCLNKNAALSGSAGNASVTVTALEMAGNFSDNCTSISFLQSKLAIARVSENLNSYPSVLKSNLTFTCTEAGQIIPVQLWTKDEANNAIFCVANITVQDNTGACSAGTATIQGLIKTESGKLVNNVTTTAILNGITVGTINSNISGSFSIANLAQGQNYQVKASKNDNLLSGLSTFDIALISKHVIGIEEFNSPYKIIAADVNRDGEVNAIDMITLRKLVLRSLTAIPNNTSWRFVDKNYVFQNPTLPLSEDFPEVISVKNTAQTVQADFVGIKIGDVNNTVNASNLRVNEGNTLDIRQESLVFSIKNKNLKKGEEYVMTFSNPNFNAAGFQFTLNTEGVEVVRIERKNLPQFTDGNVSIFKNALAISWNGNGTQETELFNIVVKATKDGRLSEMVSLGSNITTAEAFDNAGNFKSIKLEFTNENLDLHQKYEGTVANAFALYQNEPNPFDSDTNIGFDLPTDATINFTIYDASGRVLKRIQKQGTKGFNKINVSKDELGATGIYYYKLETPTHTATKKMLLTN